MLTERIVCRLAGIQPESEEIRWYSIVALEAFAKLDGILHGTTYEGALLPLAGPALLVSNHTSMWDIARGYRVGQRSRRIPRTFARDTLLDPTLTESSQVSARTGHKSDVLNSGLLPIRQAIAAVCKGAEAQPITRGGGMEVLNDFLKRGRAIFEAHQLAACFIQETRNKDGKLRNPKPGVALLAAANPDIPIYFMGVSRKRVSIKGPYTFNQLRNEPAYNQLPRKYLIVAMADKIADQLDPEERNDWYEVQRPLTLSRK